MNIGVAAHITAAAPRGPRYDEGLNSVARASTENGIWLCQTCAKLVDNDDVRYTAAKLMEWKSDAEAAAARALEHRTNPAESLAGIYEEALRLMPDLIEEMREDVRTDMSGLVREFAVLPHKRVAFGSTKARFVYFKEQHSDLQLKVDWLEEMGLVVDVTPSNVPIYRFTPDFAAWLRPPAQ